MNVSIDLLPQSKKGKVRTFPLLITSAVAVGVIAFLLVFTYVNTKTSVTLLETRITQQTEARDALQAEYAKQQNGVTTANFGDAYKTAYDFLHNTFINPVTVQENVYQFLPADAIVVDYTYENNGSLAMTIDFSSKDDAAVYLHKLLFADFVEQAAIEVIAANEENDRFETFIRMTVVTLEGDKS